MSFCGIDFSLTSPAITILGDDDKFENAKVYFLTDIKKFTGTFQNVTGLSHKSFSHPIQRYKHIVDTLLNVAQLTSSDIVYLEDYSMGSKGKVFHIAEATCILKYRLYESGIKYITVPPTVVKKQFTNRGNSDKNMMYQSFLEKTNVDLISQMHYTKNKIESPISDIVDSYSLSWMAYNNERI